MNLKCHKGSDNTNTKKKRLCSNTLSYKNANDATITNKRKIYIVI